MSFGQNSSPVQLEEEIIMRICSNELNPSFKYWVASIRLMVQKFGEKTSWGWQLIPLVTSFLYVPGGPGGAGFLNHQQYDSWLLYIPTSWRFDKVGYSESQTWWNSAACCKWYPKQYLVRWNLKRSPPLIRPPPLGIFDAKKGDLSSGEFAQICLDENWIHINHVHMTSHQLFWQRRFQQCLDGQTRV